MNREGGSHDGQENAGDTEQEVETDACRSIRCGAKHPVRQTKRNGQGPQGNGKEDQVIRSQGPASPPRVRSIDTKSPPSSGGGPQVYALTRADSGLAQLDPAFVSWMPGARL
jgi:hypothetical protein